MTVLSLRYEKLIPHFLRVGEKRNLADGLTTRSHKYSFGLVSLNPARFFSLISNLLPRICVVQMVNGKARDLKQGVLGWNLWKAYYFFCFFLFFIILRRDGLGPKICHDSFFALGMANGMGWDRVSDITRDLIGPLPFTFEG